MSDSRAALRIIVTIALVLLPLVLVALTLEPLDRSPGRTGRNSQTVVDAPQDEPATSEAATPAS